VSEPLAILCNECVTFPTKSLLLQLGHDVVHIAESERRARSDRENLEWARESGRIFVSVDRRFLIKRIGLTALLDHPGVVLLRMTHRDFSDMIRPITSFFTAMTMESLRGSLYILRFEEYERRRAMLNGNIEKIRVPFLA
jgi:hypothetical protein